MTTGIDSLEELSARFEVTTSTIRRDLARLNGQGGVARTYSGTWPADLANGGRSLTENADQRAPKQR